MFACPVAQATDRSTQSWCHANEPHNLSPGLEWPEWQNFSKLGNLGQHRLALAKRGHQRTHVQLGALGKHALGHRDGHRSRRIEGSAHGDLVSRRRLLFARSAAGVIAVR